MNQPGSHVEHEVKLDVWPGFRLPDLADLGLGITTEEHDRTHLVAVYHDTADLRLTRSGVSLRYRDGDGTGWTVKLPAAPDGVEGAVSRFETTFEGGPEAVPADVVDQVRAWVRNGELVTVARIEADRRTIRLTGPTGSSVAEVVDDEVSAYDDGHLAMRFREVEVEAAPGDPDDGPAVVAAAVDRLVEAGARPGGHRSKVARVLGPRSEEPGDLDVPDPGGGATACEVLRAGLARSARLVVVHDAGVRSGLESEAVHQARVGTRRLRSDLRAFAPLLLPGWATPLRAELSWLADALGAVRDADVLLARLEERLDGDRRGDGAALLSRLSDERELARRRLLDALDDRRYLHLLDDLVEAVQRPAVTSTAGRPAAKVLPELAAEPWRRLRKAIRALEGDPSDDRLHQVRIRAKRARYAAELASLSAGKPAIRFAKAVARLQDVLGGFNDAVVSEGWLRAAACEVPRGPADLALRLAAGERAEADRLGREWRAAWDALDTRRLRAWMRA